MASRKLVHIREDFTTGEFEMTESIRTFEELTKGAGASIEESKKTATKVQSALIVPKIEAIHAGATKNFTFYSAEKLKGDWDIRSGVYSFTHPYAKPMLTHHNAYDGEPIGRIHKAEFQQTTTADKPGIVVEPNITDPEAAQKIRDGRYKTVSIGADTDSVTCSICGWDILNDGWCPEHKRGQKYDGETAMWILGNIWFSELSFVNVPADQDAMVVSIVHDSQGGKSSSKEEHEVQDNQVLENKTPEDDVATVGVQENAQQEPLENTEDPQQDDAVQDNQTQEHDDVLETNDDASSSEDDDSDIEEADLEEKFNKLVDIVSELSQRISALEYKNEEAEEDGEDTEALEDKIADLESQVESLKAENESLVQENAQLQTQIHTSLVERVVDLKISLGKPGLEDREKAIAEHLERTTESLNDQLKDLLAEGKTYGALRHKALEKVTNPAGGAVPGEANSTIVTAEGQELPKKKEKESSLEESLKFLLSSKKR